VSRYEKGKTNLDFTEARDSKWQRHQLSHMQVCTSPAPHHSVFTGQMPFLPPNQQRQSTEGKSVTHTRFLYGVCFFDEAEAHAVLLEMLS